MKLESKYRNFRSRKCIWKCPLVKLIEAKRHIYASVNWATIGSDDGFSPVQRQAIIKTNDGELLIGLLETNFNKIGNKIEQFSFKELYLKMPSAKWQPFCISINVLTHKQLETHGCILSTVATDALVLKHQAISIRSVD